MTSDTSAHSAQILGRSVLEDVAAIARLRSIDKVLEVISGVTGLRIALVARVTRESWTCCAVLDEAGFGLHPGDTLDVSTTY